jgi:transposase-like protein
MKPLFLPLLFAGLLLLPAQAEASCQGGRTFVSGETVADVARRCGVNPEALRQLNPGLNDNTIRPGLIVAVPPRPLPSPQTQYGRPNVTLQQQQVTQPAVQMPIPAPQPAPPVTTFQRPLVGHMPSILQQPF